MKALAVYVLLVMVQGMLCQEPEIIDFTYAHVLQ